MEYKENNAKDIYVPHKEQKIIGGVDVSTCKGLKYKPDGIKKPICLGGGIRGIYRSCLCEKNQNCHFKQLARKTQECELAEQLIAGILKTLNLEAYDWRADQNEILTEIKAFKHKCEELKKGYSELTDIVTPYMDDFTGYNEELGSFDIALCVKELMEQLDQLKVENEELKKDIKRVCPDCGFMYLTKASGEIIGELDRYRKALDEIKSICLKDVHTFADGTELRYDSLDEILDIINKVKGEK